MKKPHAALDRSRSDMLSLGAKEFFVIGNIDTRVLNHVEQDPIFRNNNASLTRIYNLLAATNGASLYKQIFLKKPYVHLNSTTGSSSSGVVALVEANLYANNGIAITLVSENASNIVLNGSISKPNLSMLSTGFNHSFFDLNGAPITINPFNGLDFKKSQLNQDYRLKYTSLGYECHRIIKN